MPRRNSSLARSRTGPGMAGAGSGTAFLALARSLPEKYGMAKQLAIYLAPTISVFTAAIVVWLRETLLRYMDEARKNRDFDSVQKQLEEIRENKHTSPEEKERITRKLADLQVLRANAVLETVQLDKK